MSPKRTRKPYRLGMLIMPEGKKTASISIERRLGKRSAKYIYKLIIVYPDGKRKHHYICRLPPTDVRVELVHQKHEILRKLQYLAMTDAQNYGLIPKEIKPTTTTPNQ